MMAVNNICDVPEWFVYDTQGDLDVEATLASVPAKLETDFHFFDRVPEWFKVCSKEEIDELIREFDEPPIEEREKLTPEQIAQIHKNLQTMAVYHAIFRRYGLSANQKEVMRCLFYWHSLKTMGEIPLTKSEAEELF